MEGNLTRFGISGAKVYQKGAFSLVDLLVEDGRVFVFSVGTLPTDIPVFDMNTCFVFPGFTDVHTHLREPGFSYKETVETGTKAAAHGGYTAVCAMPNLNPVPDSVEHLKKEIEKIEDQAVISVYPYGAITIGQKGEELSDLEGMAPFVLAFSDDGKGVQSDDMMRDAMKRAKALGKMIVAHCEDESLIPKGGCIHDGAFAKAHGLIGIPSSSEYAQVARDIELVRETGVCYHVCHVSTKESVELIKKAQQEGLSVTGETGPHYLTLTEDDLIDEGRFKMNPPLREKADQEALLAAVNDGTLCAIATDHAPHSEEEKSKGLAHSNMGIVGLETAFAVLYTDLVKTGKMSLQTLIDRMATSPSQRFSLGSGEIEDGGLANLTVFSLDEAYTIDPKDFLSMGKATPYAGKEVFGKCLLTVANGKIAYKEENIHA